jgi:serine/threonine protein kinase
LAEDLTVVETPRCLGCGAALPAGIGLRRCARCFDEDSLSATAPFEPGEPAVLTVPRATIGPVSVAEFRCAVLELGLLDAEPFDRSAAEAPADVAALASVLVRAGRLTEYQAAAVMQGKARGLVVGPYMVLSKCGQGGMGVVFKARHRPTGQVVALKILPPSFARDATLVQRFQREVAAAARLDHPNIIRIVDASQDRGVPFLAMDFIEGRDLRSIVNSTGPLPIDQAVACAIQAARGLEAAHEKGIVHRDIKPANLMLDTSGVVRILDLGLARLIEASSVIGGGDTASLTQSGSYVGTADYCAPEQADDAKTVDHRADIYSLGCTLYFLATGRPPFEGDSLIKKLMAHQNRPAPSLRLGRTEVPAALEVAYQAMMAKNPADRPQSMNAVIWLLESCLLPDADELRARKGLITFVDGRPMDPAPRERGQGTGATSPARQRPGDGRPFNLQAGVYALEGGDPPEESSPAPPPRFAPSPRVRPGPGRPPRPAGLLSLVVLATLGLILIGVAQYVRSQRAPARPIAGAEATGREPALPEKPAGLIEPAAAGRASATTGSKGAKGAAILEKEQRGRKR